MLGAIYIDDFRLKIGQTRFGLKSPIVNHSSTHRSSNEIRRCPAPRWLMMTAATPRAFLKRRFLLRCVRRRLLWGCCSHPGTENRKTNGRISSRKFLRCFFEDQHLRTHILSGVCAIAFTCLMSRHRPKSVGGNEGPSKIRIATRSSPLLLM